MVAVTVRRASEADFAALSALWREADAFHAAVLPDRFREPQGDARPRTFDLAVLADPDAAIFVAEDANVLGDARQVVGFARLATRHALDVAGLVPRTHAMVEELVVASGFRRRGIGRALMAAAHAWVQQQGLTEVELSVWAFNAGAIALYQDLGYAVVSHRMARRVP